jgi:hypothetical protein
MSIHLASLIAVLRVACAEAASVRTAWTDGVERLPAASQAAGAPTAAGAARPFLGRADTDRGLARLLRDAVGWMIRSIRGRGRPAGV